MTACVEDKHVALYSLTDAIDRFLDGDGHPSKLIRWGTVGVKRRRGPRLKLELVRHPNKWLVSEEAIRAFVEALTADRTGEPAPALPPSDSTLSRSHQRAEAELTALGI